MTAGYLANRLHFPQNTSRPVDDLFADIREHDAPLAALYQSNLKLLLEFLDLRTERGLADVAALRGPAEVFLLGESDQVSEGSDADSGVNSFHLSEI